MKNHKNLLHIKSPHLVKEWHPTKNGSRKPEDFTWKNNAKVWWQCLKSERHEWEATIANRHISGCPYCSGRRKEPEMPEMELIIEDVIQERLGMSIEQVTREELLELILKMEKKKRAVDKVAYRTQFIHLYAVF